MANTQLVNLTYKYVFQPEYVFGVPFNVEALTGPSYLADPLVVFDLPELVDALPELQLLLELSAGRKVEVHRVKYKFYEATVEPGPKHFPSIRVHPGYWIRGMGYKSESDGVLDLSKGIDIRIQERNELKAPTDEAFSILFDTDPNRYLDQPKRGGVSELVRFNYFSSLAPNQVLRVIDLEENKTVFYDQRLEQRVLRFAERLLSPKGGRL